MSGQRAREHGRTANGHFETDVGEEEERHEMNGP